MVQYKKDRVTKIASIVTKNNIIDQVNDDFFQRMGYQASDIIGKSLKELGVLLKTTAQTDLESIKGTEDIYVFTSEDVPKDVTITCEMHMEEEERKYYIKVNPNNSLDNMLLNYGNDEINNNQAQSIYSYPELICLKVNTKYREALEVMGHQHDQVIGAYHLCPKYIPEVVANGYFHGNEMEHISSTGAKSYWDTNRTLIRGHKMFILSSLYDITERVLEKRYSEQQRVEMEIILDHMSDLINKVNKNGEFTYINKSAREALSMYDTEFGSLSNKQEYEMLKCTDINGAELLFEETPTQRVLKGETITNEVIIETSQVPLINRLPSAYYTCNGIPVYDKEGNIDGGIIIYKDIKDIYKANEYHALKENIVDVFLRYALLSSDNFKIKYMNEAAMAVARANHPHIKLEIDVIGKNFFDIYPLLNMDKDELISAIKQSVEEKESYSLTQKFIVEEETKYIKTIFHPRYNKKGEIENIEVVDVDISDEERANRKMNKALKMQDEMFTTISHELKTPLNVIFSGSQLLDMYLEDDSVIDIEKMQYSNKIIKQNCYRLTKLINNILDISKIESGFYQLSLENHDIVAMTGKTVNSVAEHIKLNGLKINFTPKVDHLIIGFDSSKIERVLLNLISNAIKCSNIGGVIDVNLECKDQYVEISVQDNGIGMEERNLALIFDKYKQIDTSLNRISEGNGIGLYLTKSIVKLHEGEISVRSILGQGSIFTIKLPMRTVAGENRGLNRGIGNDTVEAIKIELSDIYV